MLNYRLSVILPALGIREVILTGYTQRLKSFFSEFAPASFISLKEGYSKQLFFHDLIAGITVGIIALPLAMAFAIGSGVPPERGLYTAIIAGFLTSLLGGSRVQIGGPTGAFVVIVYSIVQRQGYDGLAIATLMAGAMLVLMGIARFGVILKFIPYPVTTGFTTGIALIIFSSQIKDFLGLSIGSPPANFIEKWHFYFVNSHTWNPWAFAIGTITLGIIAGFRYLYPKLPGAIVAVIIATLLVTAFDLPVETIEKKFGTIPQMLPSPCIPCVSFERIQSLFPDALAIALLGAIESLLCALVADGMTGHKHRSNCELIAQGLSNIGSVFFGGIPATGAIARTSANIKMGAKTPVAGMIHAVTLLAIMIFLAPLASKFPMPSLAAVLVFVAWNMSEKQSFIEIHKAPKADVITLWLTFLLTVLVDLAVAVQVGVLLAAVLFLKRMTDSTTVKICKTLAEENLHEAPEAKDSDLIFRKDLPPDTAVFEINGPFFYTVSNLLNEELRTLDTTPRYFILRMRKVTLIDATGLRALKEFKDKCGQLGIIFLMSGVTEELQAILNKSGVVDAVGLDHIFPHLENALGYCRGRKSS